MLCSFNKTKVLDPAATYLLHCLRVSQDSYATYGSLYQEDQFREERRRLGEWEQPNDGVSFAMSMPAICHNSVEDTRTTIVPFEAEPYTRCRPIVLDFDAGVMRYAGYQDGRQPTDHVRRNDSVHAHANTPALIKDQRSPIGFKAPDKVMQVVN